MNIWGFTCNKSRPFCMVQNNTKAFLTTCIHMLSPGRKLLLSLMFLQLIRTILHLRVQFSLLKNWFAFNLSLSLLYKLLLTLSVYPLCPARHPAVTCLIAADKQQPMWYDLSKGHKNYISGKWDIALNFGHLADALIESDLKWVHGSNKIRLQGHEHFKRLKWVDEPKQQHSDKRYEVSDYVTAPPEFSHIKEMV